MRKSKTKASRIYERHFASVPIFEAKGGRFSPLPWMLRRAQWLFATREWQLYTYFVMRSGPESVCWQTDREISYDLGIGPKKLAPYVRSLEEKGFIETAEAEGKRYVCIVDPRHALQKLVNANQINAERLQALNDDLELMDLEPLDGPLPSNVTPLRPVPVAKARAGQRG